MSRSTLALMTWNVNGKSTVDVRRQFIEEQEFLTPDVLFIQEAKAADDVESVKRCFNINGTHSCFPEKLTAGDAFILIRNDIGTFRDVTDKLKKK